MQRTQYDWQHEYLLTPIEYPISANQNHSTYDQFIQLRDTLIFTWKYYNDKASRKLCIGDKWDWTTTNTVEVWLPNYLRQTVQPDWETDPEQPKVLWNYVTAVPADIKSWDNRFGELSCMINKDGHYRIMHKEEILLDAWTRKVYCYVDVYRKDSVSYKIQYLWWVAVFDWESASWADYVLWDLFKKMTAMWEIEMDLLKWDILVLRMKDAGYNSETGEPTGNNLTLQDDSNYRSIEYLDLPYKLN